ncbi:P-loop containing nucleoside triphosphate hydrolase protein [Mycena metata]|uniref:P-loop containing nucleoside triphosphate hydrolase protein n=1 Tax=Mycena metata TaxID=1033252 RepID=A0AAD7JBL3_9AGAR|nr:P-loop containing nucleoside triphosphate hydrolase protein [Mycena metata]
MYHLLNGLHEHLTWKEEVSDIITLLERIRTLYADTPGLTPDKIGPTVGQNTGKITLPSTILQFWDLGGQRGIRNIWHKYYDNCHAEVFGGWPPCIARANESLLKHTKVDSVPSAPQILNVPILLIANNQDSPHALSASEIRHDYEDWYQRKVESAESACRSVRLTEPARRTERIASLNALGISAVEGTGVKAAVDWLFIRAE